MKAPTRSPQLEAAKRRLALANRELERNLSKLEQAKFNARMSAERVATAYQTLISLGGTTE
jgi:hypothetical protein